MNHILCNKIIEQYLFYRGNCLNKKEPFKSICINDLNIKFKEIFECIQYLKKKNI